MAKTKGSNPPVQELQYKDSDGILHYFGEFFRRIFSEGFIDPNDPESDIIGQSHRGSRPTQQGAGSSQQKLYREIFKNCTALWNSLPENCPDPVPDPPPTSKKSVWDAKLEHGVVCSYYDLFMRCCIKWALGHTGDMPVGDCFPCKIECTPDLAMAWDYNTSAQTIARNSSVMVAITGLNTPFSWSVSGTGFSLAHAKTEGLTNTLNADGTACGSATITITGCDGTVITGYVRCTAGQWGAWTIGCKLSGIANTKTIGANCRIIMTKTEGKYNQEQTVIGGPNTGAYKNCGDVDCTTLTNPNCIATFHHTSCMDWACSDKSANPGCAGAYEYNIDCGGWCCIPPVSGSCAPYAGYQGECDCNYLLRYREWVC